MHTAQVRVALTRCNDAYNGPISNLVWFCNSPSESQPIRLFLSLQAFLEEQGLSEVEAARLVGEMRSTGLTRFSIAAIGAKLQRWQRVLVDVDVVRLLQKDASLLERDVNLAVMNLIQLVDKLPGRDMNSLISRQPRLLWCEVGAKPTFLKWMLIWDLKWMLRI